MSAVDADDIEVVVTRREWTPPPPFRCETCERSIEADRWRDMGRAPICASCVRRWSSMSRLRTRGMTRGDLKVLGRLSAVLNCLQWEILNGRRFSR